MDDGDALLPLERAPNASNGARDVGSHRRAPHADSGGAKRGAGRENRASKDGLDMSGDGLRETG